MQRRPLQTATRSPQKMRFMSRQVLDPLYRIHSLNRGSNPQDHLARAQKGVGILLKEIKSLRERNQSLTAELQDLRDAAGTSNRTSKEELQRQVQMLTSDKRKLERVSSQHI